MGISIFDIFENEGCNLIDILIPSLSRNRQLEAETRRIKIEILKRKKEGKDYSDLQEKLVN